MKICFIMVSLFLLIYVYILVIISQIGEKFKSFVIIGDRFEYICINLRELKGQKS